jgi:hypothetical protein
VAGPMLVLVLVLGWPPALGGVVQGRRLVPQRTRPVHSGLPSDAFTGGGRTAHRRCGEARLMGWREHDLGYSLEGSSVDVPQSRSLLGGRKPEEEEMDW